MAPLFPRQTSRAGGESTYGFDLTSVTNNNSFFEWLGTCTNVLSGGAAYNGSTIGAPDNTLNQLAGDRVFLVQLTPQAHPTLISNQLSGNQFQLSWSTNYAGYLIESGTNLNGPWSYSGLNVSVLNGTNFATDSISNNADFYRLQYLAGPRPMPIVSWQTNANGLAFQMSTGVLQLQVFSREYRPCHIRPRRPFANQQLRRPGSPDQFGLDGNAGGRSVSLNTSLLQVKVNRATGAVGFYDTNGRSSSRNCRKADGRSSR